MRGEPLTYISPTKREALLTIFVLIDLVKTVDFTCIDVHIHLPESRVRAGTRH